ncbi:uncharacterized protein M6B38_359685 [Iris pallida]|uniref:3'-5' exonuclease domain-containing protein n=1 Tax=Iris pallida TaxID=29817 RepID=A0AAX6FAJ8_IRIPA|nr:uncharacterized protein M6B38_143935 [Iris pallida]KAJ6829069.1 uncharacterized protein M6B38_359685 [Iris pallida]
MESKKWKSVELRIERVFDDEEGKKTAEYRYRLDRAIYVVIMAGPYGEDVVVLDTTVTSNKNVVSDWIGAVRGPDRRSLRSPRIAGISFYKGAFYRPRRHNGCGLQPPPLPTIAAISICVGGSRCLVYVVDSDDLYPARGAGREPYSFVSRHFQEFLEDRSVSFVGFGIEKAVATLKIEWGVDVAKPVDAVKLATEVIGKERESVFKLQAEKGKGKWSRSSADHVLAVPMSKEEITAMATGVMVEGPPSSMKEADWDSVEYLAEETVMHAAADAFMAFQVGDALLKKK